VTGRDLTMPRDAIERTAFTLIPSIAVRLFLRSCLNDRDAELDEIRERYAELEQHSAHYAARADGAARERDAALDRIRHLEQRPAPFVDDQDGALEALNARIEAVRESLRRHGYEHTTMRPVAGSEELGPVLLRSDVIEFVDEIRASVDPSCAPPLAPEDVLGPHATQGAAVAWLARRGWGEVERWDPLLRRMLTHPARLGKHTLDEALRAEGFEFS